MKRQYLILLAAGVVLACLVYRAGRKSPDEVIKPGDKGNDVYALQDMLEKMSGVKFQNMGAYDKDTLAAVQYYMQGSPALTDYEKGYVSKSFISNLEVIENKIKT
jgi:hypothetical protein